MAQNPAPAALRKKLGDLMVEAGIITSAQLQEALEEQRKKGGKLGQILIGLGYVTEDVFLAFLGKQLGVSFVSLEEYGEIPRDVIESVPESIARRQKMIPIARENNTLTVAMADPLNVFATDDLKLMTGYDVKVVIASEAEIKHAIEHYYTELAAEASTRLQADRPSGPAAEEVPEISMTELLRDLEKKGGEADVDVVKEADTGEDIVKLGITGEDAPVIKIVNLMLSNAVKAKASDIHVEPYEKILRVRYRIDGVLHNQPSPPKKLQNAIISRIKIMAKLDIAERRLPQDGRIKIRLGRHEIDLRVSTIPVAFGEKVVMRILDSSALCLDLTKLGFDPDTLAVYEKNIKVPYGIILVTGPTGSGKSTTLYSSLHQLNNPDVNIITIEDPVEYMLEGINQVQARPDIGLTFASGLRSFLRQDPDIIMVGEIRDTETAEIAINAALTGHLVFSTLHTNDAPGAMTRLNNMGIEPFLTTSTVVMVVAQRLVRVICSQCKEPYEAPAELLIEAGAKPKEIEPKMKDGKVTLYRGRGCAHCSKTGYRGRIGLYEVMEITDPIRELVLDRASTHVIKQKAREEGMVTLREAAVRKVLAGVTTVEEMMRVTYADVAAEEE